MQEMIGKSKQAQLDDSRQQQQMRLADNDGAYLALSEVRRSKEGRKCLLSSLLLFPLFFLSSFFASCVLTFLSFSRPPPAASVALVVVEVVVVAASAWRLEEVRSACFLVFPLPLPLLRAPLLVLLALLPPAVLLLLRPRKLLLLLLLPPR